MKIINVCMPLLFVILEFLPTFGYTTKLSTYHSQDIVEDFEHGVLRYWKPCNSDNFIEFTVQRTPGIPPSEGNVLFNLNNTLCLRSRELSLTNSTTVTLSYWIESFDDQVNIDIYNEFAPPINLLQIPTPSNGTSFEFQTATAPVGVANTGLHQLQIRGFKRTKSSYIVIDKIVVGESEPLQTTTAEPTTSTSPSEPATEPSVTHSEPSAEATTSPTTSDPSSSPTTTTLSESSTAEPTMISTMSTSPAESTTESATATATSETPSQTSTQTSEPPSQTSTTTSEPPSQTSTNSSGSTTAPPVSETTSESTIPTTLEPESTTTTSTISSTPTTTTSTTLPSSNCHNQCQCQCQCQGNANPFKLMTP